MGLTTGLLKAAFLLAAFFSVLSFAIIDEREIQVQIVGHRSVALCTALIRRDHDTILPIFDVPFDPLAKERLNLRAKIEFHFYSHTIPSKGSSAE